MGLRNLSSAVNRMARNLQPTGTTQPDPVYDCIGEYVDFYAQSRPESTAIVFGNSRVSYKQLKHDVDACANSLLALGVQKGDRVCVLCTPRTEYWVLFLATTRIGAIWVGLNPKYKLDEMRYIVSDCEPKLLFALSAFDGREYADDVAALCQDVSSIKNVIAIDNELSDAMLFGDLPRLATSVPAESYTASVNSVKPGDPALIVYTSGTTGNPKGAMLSHYGLTRGATMQTGHIDIDRPALVVNFPINHVACVADTCATTLVKGGKIVFQERFDVAASLQAIESERCTMLGGVPTMLQMQLEHPLFEDIDLSSIQLVAWGGAAMPRDCVKRLRKLAPRLMQLYGMTETSANIVFGDDSATVDQLSESIGKPDSAVECRIVDDTGSSCAVGQSGELQFRADFFFLGYWNLPDKTREAWTDDGWLKTGDIGSWRDDGNIEFVGRTSEMFKSGGDNVYPREVETVLESIPEVAMAAVISVPDDLYQEVGHAFILLAPGQTISDDELRVVCEHKLANYKIPKRFKTGESLPMLPVGKIDKQALKRLALESHDPSTPDRESKVRSYD